MTTRPRLDRLARLWPAGDEEAIGQLAAQLWCFLAWEGPPEPPAERLRRWLRIAHAYGLPPVAEAEALRRALVRLGVPPHEARAVAGGMAPLLAARALPDELIEDEVALAEGAIALLKEVAA